MHLRWSITNPYLIFVGGPDMAPKPPNVRTAPGNPWRSSILVPSRGPDLAPKPPNVRTAPGNPWRSSNARPSFEQYVPPNAPAGERAHHEEHAPEPAGRQPPPGPRAPPR